MIDFSLYPKTAELLEETDMTDQADRIVFLQKDREDAAVLLAEMHLMALAAVSPSIPLRNRSLQAVNHFYNESNNSVHVFAQEQAHSDLGLTFEVKFRLFKHKSIFSVGPLK